MASTYADIKWGLDDIAKTISRGRSFIDNSRSSLVRAQDLLGTLPGDTAELRNDIDDAAVANPNDDAYQMAKNEKDKLVADFQALNTYTGDLIAAWDAVEE